MEVETVVWTDFFDGDETSGDGLKVVEGGFVLCGCWLAWDGFPLCALEGLGWGGNCEGREGEDDCCLNHFGL